MENIDNKSSPASGVSGRRSSSVRKCLYRVVVIWMITSACLAHAQTAVFQGLGDLPGGDNMSEAWAVSADGLVVVGRSSTETDQFEAVKWTVSGLESLGDLPGGPTRSLAKGVSADGSVIVGWGVSNNNQEEGSTEAFRWTEATGMVGLGDLPDGEFDSDAWSVSADGSVVVGEANGLYFGGPNSGGQAFRWTAGTGMVSLGNLSGDPFFSFARDVSADGDVVVGQSDESNSCTSMGFQWIEGAGMSRLGDLFGGTCWSIARGVSADGTKMAGSAVSGQGMEAVVWAPSFFGPLAIGDLPGGQFYAEGWAVSGDGTLAVGLGRTDDGERAFLWDTANGMRQLDVVLNQEHGVDLNGWILNEARDISGDGRTIVGIGTNPAGDKEGWVVKFLDCMKGDMTSDGNISMLDVPMFVATLLDPGTANNELQCAADVNDDGSVDGEDVSGFVSLLL